MCLCTNLPAFSDYISMYSHFGNTPWSTRLKMTTGNPSPCIIWKLSVLIVWTITTALVSFDINYTSLTCVLRVPNNLEFWENIDLFMLSKTCVHDTGTWYKILKCIHYNALPPVCIKYIQQLNYNPPWPFSHESHMHYPPSSQPPMNHCLTQLRQHPTVVVSPYLAC